MPLRTLKVNDEVQVPDLTRSSESPTFIGGFPRGKTGSTLDPDSAARVVSGALGHEISCGGPLRPTMPSVSGCQQACGSRMKDSAAIGGLGAYFNGLD